jgi:ATP-dependent Clp protease protease subunit
MNKENLTKEFRNYSVKHLGLSGTTVDDVMKYQDVQASRTPYILEEREMRVSQLDVFSRLMMDRQIFLSGVVDQNMADITQAQLLFLESVDPNRDITFLLSSPGGSVLSGLSIVDTMEYIKPDVACINLGLAASMGSIILSSSVKGKRSSLNFAKVMIHQVSSGASGHVADNRISQMESEKYNYILFKMLAQNSGRDFDYVLEAARRDKWLNAYEALEFGFIDEIINSENNRYDVKTLMDGFDDYYKKEVLNK